MLEQQKKENETSTQTGLNITRINTKIRDSTQTGLNITRINTKIKESITKSNNPVTPEGELLEETQTRQQCINKFIPFIKSTIAYCLVSTELADTVA